MARLGVELATHTIRGVRLEGWPRPRPRAVEIAWDRDEPDEAVQALGQHLGPARRLAVAVDLPLLFTKRVKLPPLPAAERRRILRLEPERFFAVRADDIVPAVRADDDLVFAAREAPLAAWVSALERLAPVDLVEPAPLALARALACAPTPLADGVALFDGRGDGVGLVELRGGRVTRARRLYGDVADAAAALSDDGAPATLYLSGWSEERAAALAALLPGVTLQPLPPVPNLAEPFLAAYGAALAVGTEPDFASTLVSPELGRVIRARHRRELGLAVAACVAAVVFALTSVDAWRARATRELGAGLQALRERAAPALALQARLETMAQQAAAIRQIEVERLDPLRVLLALSRQLPPGAYVRGIRVSGTDWQVDGYAPNAARLIAGLGAAPGFKEVHFLSATNRAEVGDRTYESFALAFRYAPAP
jgi:Tfp pilus assembly protein PilN